MLNGWEVCHDQCIEYSICDRRKKKYRSLNEKKEHYSSKGMFNTDKRVATENVPRYCLGIIRSARKSLTSLSIGYEIIGNSYNE